MIPFPNRFWSPTREVNLRVPTQFSPDAYEHWGTGKHRLSLHLPHHLLGGKGSGNSYAHCIGDYTDSWQDKHLEQYLRLRNWQKDLNSAVTPKSPGHSQMILCRGFHPSQCSSRIPKKAVGIQARMCIHVSDAAHPLERSSTYLKAKRTS